MADTKEVNEAQAQDEQQSQKTIKLIIKRQDDAESNPYEEEFEIPYKENLNVIACLMEIRRNPINSKGEKTTPVIWDMNCLKKSVALVRWLSMVNQDNLVRQSLTN